VYYFPEMLKPFFVALIALGASAAPTTKSHIARKDNSNLSFKLSVANGLLDSPVDGRIVLILAPDGDVEDIGVTSSLNNIFGKNVYDFDSKSSVTFSGGSNDTTETGVYGWPKVSLSEVVPGNYTVQAFLSRYETVTRSDGSKVSVRFPCGDGGANIKGHGSLITAPMEAEISGGAQTLKLSFTNITASDITGKETGGCNQGNYKDTKYLKHIKIRSKKLSEFWGRDMYVGANVVLPAEYDANDTKTRYPVIYHQGHWAAGEGSYRYGSDKDFTAAWDAGMIPGTNTTAERPAPKFILVTFRHEAPFYDDSYAVNTANLGPYGDAINDELIPHIDDTFHTIRAPYARIQDGGSTGGWISFASMVYRPDLFGACFSSYPDSLDFHRLQNIELYSAENAYQRADGSFVPSIRSYFDGEEELMATVGMENQWELAFGTASRSMGQWDIWNAVFGVQGYNQYPLEPWDKVTGEIFPDAVQEWKPFDLSDYIVTNFNSSRNLGAALVDRLFVWVGAWDDYYLNEAMVQFQNRTDAVGGAGWANVTILPEKPHGGNYLDLEIWHYLTLVDSWVRDHAPDGPKPLSASSTDPSTRGNVWEEVVKRGGREAAVKRQADPVIQTMSAKVGQEVVASVGRWDPGVKLTAQWTLKGKPVGKFSSVEQGTVIKYAPTARGDVQLLVTGKKRNYNTEVRKSQQVRVAR
jgi:hypothetical protein